MKKIYSELSRIQKDLKAPKNMLNRFGNYAYRNAEGILEAIKPLLKDLALIINDEPIMVGDRFYIKATVTLTDGEESVSAVAYAREDETKKGMDGCQLTGACSSYARKYALNALLMIDDTKDSDDDSLSPKNPENQKEEKKAAPVKKDAPATVEKIDKVPALQQKVEQAAEIDPVKKYLLQCMGDMREARQISAAENNKIFKAQRETLIKAKMIPDKKLEAYTMEEAQDMVDKMYKCFTPTGTELVTE
jgi:hypothetical protein